MLGRTINQPHRLDLVAEEIPAQPPIHIIGSHTKHLGDQQHLMSRLLQTPGCFSGHILVHQKPHSSRCAVCAVTSGSISF